MEEDDDTHQCRACKMVIQGLDNYIQHRKVTCVRLSGKKSQTDESVSVNEDGASKPISETFAATFTEIFTAKAVKGTENENHPASSSFQSPIVDKDPAEKIPSQPHDDSEEPDKVETGTPGCPPMIMTVESVDDKDHHKEPRSQNFQIPFLLKPCTTRMGFSCKTCGVEFNNTFEIKKHLASKQHLKKVGCAEDDAENSKNRSEEVEGERPESPPMAMTVDCVNDDLSSDDGSGFGPDNMEDEDRLHDEDTPQATSSASGVDDIEVQGTYCDVCQHEFGYKSKLKEHLRSKRHHKAASEHSDSYCEACKYDYSYPSRLESHLKSKKHLRVVGALVGKTKSDHGYCEVCQQDFGYKSKLEQHCRSQRHIKAASEATTNTREKSDKAVEEGGTSKTSDDFIDKDSPQTSAHEDVPQGTDSKVSQQDLGYKDKLREHPESKKHLKAASDGYCEVCQWDYKCKSHLEIHLGTKRHREATMGGRSKSGLGYCKLCRWDFKCKSKLESHFLTEKHIRQVSRKESSTRKKRSAPSKRRKDTGHKDDDGTTGIKSKTESSVQNVEEPATGDQDETRRKDRNDEEDDKESHVNVNMESNMKNDSRVKNEKKQKKRKKKLTQIDSSDCSSGTDADEHSEVSDYNNGRTPSDTKPKRKMKKYRKRSKRVAPKVTCKYCNKVFDDSWLFWHVEKHCKEKKEGCNLCYPCRHVAFTSEEHEEHCKTQDHALFQEMYKHIKEKQKGCLKIYSCTLCEYQTNSKDQIEIHVPKHLVEKGKVFSCNQCDKSFSSRRRRRQHIERDHEKSWEKTCVCDVCGKRFYNDGNMAIHMRLHKGLKPHKCTYEGCAYRAKVPSELKTHMRRHTGEKPYLCDRCSYASVTQQGLSRHVRHKHTRPAERLLKCEHCNYTTLQHTNLRRHITTHTGEKPYKCPYCLYRCNDDTNLRKHIKNKHQGVKLYNCKSCDFGTDKLRDFFNHQRGTHGMDIVEDYRGSFMAGMTIDTMNPRFLRVSSSNPQEPEGTTDKQEGEEASAVAAIIPNDNIPDGESGETASDTTQPSSAVSILEDLVEEMSASLQPTEEAQQDT